MKEILWIVVFVLSLASAGAACDGSGDGWLMDPMTPVGTGLDGSGDGW